MKNKDDDDDMEEESDEYGLEDDLTKSQTTFVN